MNRYRVLVRDSLYTNLGTPKNNDVYVDGNPTIGNDGTLRFSIPNKNEYVAAFAAGTWSYFVKVNYE